MDIFSKYFFNKLNIYLLRGESNNLNGQRNYLYQNNNQNQYQNEFNNNINQNNLKNGSDNINKQNLYGL